MALISVIRMSSSSGTGSVTFDIHMAPLMTGPCRDNACSFDTERVLSASKRRTNPTTSSVRRSHLVDVGDSHRECHSADLMRAGTLGKRNRMAFNGLCMLIPPSSRTSDMSQVGGTNEE